MEIQVNARHLQLLHRFKAFIGREIEWVYQPLCSALLLWFVLAGVCLTFLLPPFQVPDEQLHWTTANTRVDSSIRTQKVGCSPFNNLPEFLGNLPIRFESHLKVQVGKFERLSEVSHECFPTAIAYGSVLSYPGIILSRIIHFSYKINGRSALIHFLSSRVLHGLLVALLLFRLLRLSSSHSTHALEVGSRIVPGAASILALASSPLFIQQSFAVTSDVVVNLSVISLATLLLLSDRIQTLDLLIYLASGLVASTTKPVIAPFFMLPILFGIIDSSPVGWPRGQKTKSVLWFSGACILASLISVFTNKTLLGTSGKINSAENLKFLLSDPFHAIRTLTSSAIDKMFDMTGLTSPLGWVDLHLSSSVTKTWLSIFCLCLFLDVTLAIRQNRPASSNCQSSKVGKMSFALVSGLVMNWGSAIGTTLAMYLCCTSLDYDGVYAVQSRYFFPNWIILIGVPLAAARFPLQPSASLNTTYLFRRPSLLQLARWALAGWGFLMLLKLGLNFAVDVLIRYY